MTKVLSALAAFLFYDLLVFIPTCLFMANWGYQHVSQPHQSLLLGVLLTGAVIAPAIGFVRGRAQR